MKKINFLTKLYQKGKISLVEPSDDIKKAYLERSRESLSSAKVLLKTRNLKDSVALAYYAMYHSLLGALFKIGIKSENHTGSIILLKEIFNIDNSVISKSKSERVDKQYYVDFEIKLEETEYAIKQAEEFVSIIYDLLAKLSEQEIIKLREKAIDLFE